MDLGRVRMKPMLSSNHSERAVASATRGHQLPLQVTHENADIYAVLAAAVSRWGAEDVRAVLADWTNSTELAALVKADEAEDAVIVVVEVDVGAWREARAQGLL
jgi:hypothetical protein